MSYSEELLNQPNNMSGKYNTQEMYHNDPRFFDQIGMDKQNRSRSDCFKSTVCNLVCML